MNVPDVAQKRTQWLENLSGFDKNKLVFIDESGVNTDLTRIYGRSFGGTRCVDNVPLSTPTNTTILSSIRLNGATAFTTYFGGTTAEKFLYYLENILIPTLKKGDIIVMDNMRSHHVKAVREVIENADMNLLYLPPYSPDFNPIENMWSKIKAVLRRMKVRNLSELPDAINMAFSSVSQSDCSGWFSAAFM